MLLHAAAAVTQQGHLSLSVTCALIFQHAGQHSRKIIRNGVCNTAMCNLSFMQGPPKNGGGQGGEGKTFLDRVEGVQKSCYQLSSFKR